MEAGVSLSWYCLTITCPSWERRTTVSGPVSSDPVLHLKHSTFISGLNCLFPSLTFTFMLQSVGEERGKWGIILPFSRAQVVCISSAHMLLSVTRPHQSVSMLEDGVFSWGGVCPAKLQGICIKEERDNSRAASNYPKHFLWLLLKYHT